jgi:putative transcriptional regulator
MKKKYMSDDDFALLMQSANEALDHATGKRNDLRVTKLPPPPKPLSKTEIVDIRKSMSASQAVFARILNISVATVRAWERGSRIPGDGLLKLLTIAKEYPHALLGGEQKAPAKIGKRDENKRARATTRA